MNDGLCRERLDVIMLSGGGHWVIGSLPWEIVQAGVFLVSSLLLTWLSLSSFRSTRYVNQRG